MVVLNFVYFHLFFQKIPCDPEVSDRLDSPPNMQGPKVGVGLGSLHMGECNKDIHYVL